MKNLSTLFEATPGRGVFTHQRLAHWQELLEEWCVIHERYCGVVRRDAIYWEGERSNLAALAAAAWRSGWAALEEFSQDKVLKRARFSGRADLYLKSPKSEDYVESKMYWWLGGTGSVNPSGALRALRAGCADARALRLHAGSRKQIGVVFVVPYFRGEIRKTVTELLEPFFADLPAGELEAVAWCFPPPARALSWDATVYPGVILLAKSAI